MKIKAGQKLITTAGQQTHRPGKRLRAPLILDGPSRDFRK